MKKKKKDSKKWSINSFFYLFVFRFKILLRKQLKITNNARKQNEYLTKSSHVADNFINFCETSVNFCSVETSLKENFTVISVISYSIRLLKVILIKDNIILRVYIRIWHDTVIRVDGLQVEENIRCCVHLIFQKQ